MLLLEPPSPRHPAMRKKLSFGQIKYFAHQEEDETRNAVVLRTHSALGTVFLPVWRCAPMWAFSTKTRKAIKEHRRRIREAKTFKRRDR
jgi:hypothetical protein